MQVDFTIIRRGRQPLKAFVTTLGFSRASYVHFFDHECSDAWLTGQREASHFFGSVPQEMLFDNASTIILACDAYGEGPSYRLPGPALARHLVSCLSRPLSPRISSGLEQPASSWSMS